MSYFNKREVHVAAGPSLLLHLLLLHNAAVAASAGTCSFASCMTAAAATTTEPVTGTAPCRSLSSCPLQHQLHHRPANRQTC